MAGLYGNLLINKKTVGFSSPEGLIKLLINNNSLEEFLKMVEIVKAEELKK